MFIARHHVSRKIVVIIVLIFFEGNEIRIFEPRLVLFQFVFRQVAAGVTEFLDPLCDIGPGYRDILNRLAQSSQTEADSVAVVIFSQILAAVDCRIRPAVSEIPLQKSGIFGIGQSFLKLPEDREPGALC